MIIIDKLCYLSKLRYVNPFEKFFFAMLTLVFCIVSRSIALGIFVTAVNSFLTVRKGGISVARYIKLMMIPLGFLILSTIAIMINISRQPLDAFAFSAGGWYITGSIAGLSHAAQLIVTALASVSCLYFLSFNTTMTDILEVLRKLHIPSLMSELLLLTYRYIFILLDIAYYISTAQSARLGYKDFKTSIKSFAAMVQVLFIRAMKRSRNLYDAMDARGYDGRIRVLDESRSAKPRNIILISVYEACLLAFTVYIKMKG